MLTTLGLNETAERVYRSLLAFPSHGVAELCADLLLPERQVRAALDVLADLALLRRSREQVGERRPVSLQRAVAILLERREAELEAQRAQMAVNRQQAQDLFGAGRPAAGGVGDSVERRYGLDAVQTRLEQLMSAATTEVMAVLPGGPQPVETLAAARPLDESLAARGLELRSLYQDSMRNDRVNLEYARWLVSQGAQVRTAPLVPPRMILIDRRIAVVPVEPGAARRGIALLQEPGVLSSLVTLFEQNWGAATELDTVVDRTAEGVTATERQLLKMLASGMTDEAAAKRLGVSLRTVRRRMEDLMSRLGASSRFQAGMKANLRGWL